MTLVEALYIFLCIILSAVGAKLGTPWGSLGTIVGALVGLGAIPTAGWLLYLAAKYWRRRVPFLPHCKTGTCTEEEYTIMQNDRHGLIAKCRCGDTYIKTMPARGERQKFYFLGQNGIRVPYLERVRFGRWRSDHQNNT